MIVGKVIYSLLAASGTIDAIIGQNIYPLKAPQGQTGDFVIYSTINAEPENTKTSYNDYDNILVQIVSFSTSYNTVTDLADKVRTVLIASDNQHGVRVGDLEIDRIFFTSQDELYDDDTKYYQIIQDYMIHLKQ